AQLGVRQQAVSSTFLRGVPHCTVPFEAVVLVSLLHQKTHTHRHRHIPPHTHTHTRTHTRTRALTLITLTQAWRGTSPSENTHTDKHTQTHTTTHTTTPQPN